MRWVCFLFLLLHSSCGYRGGSGGKEALLTIPYIQGDRNGFFTGELIRQISESASFRYSNHDGDFLLRVVVLEICQDQIGYRRDLMRENGEVQDNIRPTEGRQTMKARVSLEEMGSSEVVWGPHVFTSDVDYDYVDQDSLQDLSFVDPGTGLPTTALKFSLGQLEPSENAQEAALAPLYRKLSQKILDAISAGW